MIFAHCGQRYLQKITEENIYIGLYWISFYLCYILLHKVQYACYVFNVFIFGNQFEVFWKAPFQCSSICKMSHLRSIFLQCLILDNKIFNSISSWTYSVNSITHRNNTVVSGLDYKNNYFILYKWDFRWPY